MDQVEEQWDDTDINRFLGFGLLELEKEILKIDPGAFLEINRADIVGPATPNNEFYEWPAGMLYETEVSIKDETSGDYVPIRRGTLKEAREAVADATIIYVRYDSNFLMLSPKPSKSIVNGLQVTGVPMLTMAVDTDVPPIKIILQPTIPLFAELFAVPEVGSGDERTSKELARIVNGIPLYYVKSGGTPQYLEVAGVDKGY
jgi:hypothetical protein